MDYASAHAVPGLKGVWLTLRLYTSQRDVWSLVDEMKARDRLGYDEKRQSLWRRWQLNRFYRQLGGFSSTAIFRAYYEDDPRPSEVTIPDGPGGDGGGVSAPLRPYRRSRVSPLARLLWAREPALAYTGIG